MYYDKSKLSSVIPELIAQRDIRTLREIFAEYNIVDLADIFQDLSMQEAVFLFRILNKDYSGELFSYLDNEHQEKLINILSSLELKSIVDNMFVDDIVDLIEEMPANVVNKLLKSINEQDRREINQLLSYKEDSAGSIMTTEFIELKSDDSVKTAIEKIRSTGINVESINLCFVIDNYRTYQGMVYLRDIIINDNNKLIKDLISETKIYALTDDDQEQVANLVRDYDLEAIPILNNEEKLIGIITADDVLDVLVEEADEDLQKMSGLNPSEDIYLKSSTISIVRNRIYWLLVLMISATFTGYIIQYYEDKLTALTILAASIPVIMSTSGNSGSQSSAMIIRAIATDNLSIKDIFYIIKKEFLVALLTGTVMGLLNFMRLYLFTSNMNFSIALVITLTITFAIMISDIIGAILPLIAQIFKIDPATMAAPLITTLVDATSLIVYFSLATLILKI